MRRLGEREVAEDGLLMQRQERPDHADRADRVLDRVEQRQPVQTRIVSSFSRREHTLDKGSLDTGTYSGSKKFPHPSQTSASLSSCTRFS